MAFEGVTVYEPTAVGAVVEGPYEVAPVPAYVYVELEIASAPCRPDEATLGVMAVPYTGLDDAAVMVRAPGLTEYPDVEPTELP